jgi:hypothetical protein
LKPSAQNGCFGVFWEPQAILGGLTHGRSWGQLPPMSRSKLTLCLNFFFLGRPNFSENLSSGYD